MSMQWVFCNDCQSSYAVSDDDDPSDWVEPCEVCGASSWRIERDGHEKIYGDRKGVDYE